MLGAQGGQGSRLGTSCWPVHLPPRPRSWSGVPGRPAWCVWRREHEGKTELRDLLASADKVGSLFTVQSLAVLAGSSLAPGLELPNGSARLCPLLSSRAAYPLSSMQTVTQTPALSAAHQARPLTGGLCKARQPRVQVEAAQVHAQVSKRRHRKISTAWPARPPARPPARTPAAARPRPPAGAALTADQDPQPHGAARPRSKHQV